MKLKTVTQEVPVLPAHLQEHFSEYEACVFDGHCGEPIGWGFKPLHHLGDVLWSECAEFGEWECLYPDWYLIVKKLTLEEAKKKYGEKVEYETGPRGGWRSVTIGGKTFCSRYLDQ